MNSPQHNSSSMENMTIKQLQDELKSRNLPVNGSKRVLLNRIRQYDRSNVEPQQPRRILSVSQIENLAGDVILDDSALSSSTIIMSDENLRAREWEIIEREKKLLEKERLLLKQEQELASKLKKFQARTSNTNNRQKVICNVKEISDAIPLFSPGDVSSLSTESWLKRVDGLSKLYEWDERALLLAVASKIQGPARYWWDTKQEVCSSWEQLAEVLKTNFPHQTNEIDIHQQLIRKVKKASETIENYCFEMNMLGKRIKLTDRTIILWCTRMMEGERKAFLSVKPK